MLQGVINGNTTAFVRYDKLYLGNVKNAGGNTFRVLVKAVVDG
ncbi:hypothetical protein [Polyangium sp. 6x1]|nr:hypothetical protein [Polyangium sp. 6x1]MDI1451827.1 hypothetical protein [Polyangium sp. 6x1]